MDSSEERVHRMRLGKRFLCIGSQGSITSRDAERNHPKPESRGHGIDIGKEYLRISDKKHPHPMNEFIG